MNLGAFRGLEEYEPQDVDSAVLLSEMPLNVLMGSIEKQFIDPTESNNTDYVQSFITKYQVTKNTYTEEEDFEELSKLYDTFVSFMENILRERLNIGMPELDNISEDDQLELIHYIYRFFILNIKKNFTSFIYHWIKENGDSIAEDLPKRKDVSANALREVIEEGKDLAIITNLNIVITMALNDQSVDVDEFLSLARGKGADLENDFITDHFDSFDITGNFVEPYCKLLDEDTLVEIECKVRNKILKKYRKK